VTTHSKIINKAKQFIKNNTKKNFFSPFFFFCSWAENLGFLFIKDFANQKYSFFLRLKILINELIFNNCIQLKCSKKIKSNKYEKIALSYFYPKNLTNKGQYFDKYFSIKTNKLKNTLWILIPLGIDNLNYSLNEDTVLLKRKNRINILITTQIFFKFILNFLKSFFFLKLSNLNIDNNQYDKNLFKILEKFITENNIEKILYPYESQPHQNYLNYNIRKYFPHIKIIGYMHTVIPPLPLEYLKKDCEPDLLLVNGPSQKNVLTKKLGWSSNQVKSISSMRYNMKINFGMNKKIFLPYYIEEEMKFFELFKNLVYSKPKFFFPKLEIRNHPSMSNSKRHLRLIKRISYFLKDNKKLFKTTLLNNKISIFFGSTASVLEGLERSVRVFHICGNDIFEKFDNFYWKDIKIKKINKNIYEYRILKKGCIIRFGNEKTTLNTLKAYF
tara:strand:+ start:3381 stop:4709 length:1329 start_codon:yes stop_codon:yes gene_type:complete